MKRSQIRSPYMEWAKLHSSARYNLAASGIMNFPISQLPVQWQQIEINGSNMYGYPPLLERIAHHSGVTPDWVVTAQGTSMANHLAMAGLLEPGDEVLVEEPTYELLLTLARFLGARICRFPRRAEDGYAIDTEDVARQISPRTRLIVITNLHNPSSALVSQETLKKIGELAQDAGARVLVDEVYLEAAFENPQPSAIKLGKEFVVTSSLTKGYGLSGLRCGWVLAEPSLAARLWRINDVFAATGPFPAEQLSAVAFDHLDTIAKRAQQLLATNRKTWNDFVRAQDGLESPTSAVGTTAFPRLGYGTAGAFCELLHKKFETSVVPGRYFERSQHFRVGLCGDPQMTEEGIRRLGQALQEYSISSAQASGK
jgi:aspartate/methionine/tyrosine aminotransferase